MAIELKTLMEAQGYSSNNRLGEAVFTLWKEREASGENLPTGRNIGTYIGNLRKGNKTWWEKRPHVASILAEILEIDAVDLGLASPSIPTSRRWSYPDFPQLKPFDPLTESPCDLGILVTPHQPRQPTERNLWSLQEHQCCTWIELPPGVGRRFVLHWHKVRHHEVTTIESETLANAVQELPSRDFSLISVERPDESDIGSLERAARRGHLAVLATFPRPNTARSESQNPNQGPTNTTVAPIWFDFHWAFYQDWRDRLVQWIANRIIDEETFDVHFVLSWLNHVDPNQALFRTPGDLIPLLAYAHEHGERRLDRFESGFVLEWAQRAIAVHADTHTACGLWLHSHGMDALHSLIEGRWKRVDLNWQGPLPQEKWIALLPQSSTPEVELEVLDANLEKLVAAKKKRERETIRDELRTQLLNPSPELAINYLRVARLFRLRGSDSYTMQPSWLASWWVRTIVKESLERGITNEWGRWCVDTSRRTQVEPILDHLENKAFTRLLKGVVENFEPSTLSKVGALEALFSSVGRRLEQDWQGDSATLHQLWQYQVSLLIERRKIHGELFLSPLTRDDLKDATWIADCWSWSLGIPAPDDIPDELIGLFPGWCDSFDLTKLPQAILHGLSPSTGQNQPLLNHEKGPIMRAMGLFRKILAHCTNGSLSEKNYLPIPLILCITLSQYREQWHIGKKVGVLVNTPWATKHLLEEAHKLPTGEQTQVASYLMRNLLEEQHIRGLFVWLAGRTELYQWIVDHLHSSVIVDYLVEQNPQDLEHGFTDIPRRFWPEVLRHVMKQPDGSSIHISMTIFPQLGTDAVDILWEAVDNEKYVQYRLIERIWQLDPTRAWHRTQKQLQSKLQEQETNWWCAYSPSAYRPLIVEELSQIQELPATEWMERWLANLLLEAPTLADQIYKLLYQVRPTQTLLQDLGNRT